MTREDKELLLKDLCARLPYAPKVVYNCIIETLSTLHIFDMTHIKEEYVDIKPFLRPMSSMTEEEVMEYNEQIDKDTTQIGKELDNPYACVVGLNALDWLNKKMFDYRGLIPMDLALKASNDMYKTE